MGIGFGPGATDNLSHNHYVARGGSNVIMEVG